MRVDYRAGRGKRRRRKKTKASGKVGSKGVLSVGGRKGRRSRKVKVSSFQVEFVSSFLFIFNAHHRGNISSDLNILSSSLYSHLVSLIAKPAGIAKARSEASSETDSSTRRKENEMSNIERRRGKAGGEKKPSKPIEELFEAEKKVRSAGNTGEGSTTETNELDVDHLNASRTSQNSSIPLLLP